LSAQIISVTTFIFTTFVSGIMTSAYLFALRSGRMAFYVRCCELWTTIPIPISKACSGFPCFSKALAPDRTQLITVIDKPLSNEFHFSNRLPHQTTNTIFPLRSTCSLARDSLRLCRLVPKHVVPTCHLRYIFSAPAHLSRQISVDTKEIQRTCH
jgi:hypothetical protein